jgi:hypothetical protein
VSEDQLSEGSVPDTIQVLVLSVHEDMGLNFIETVCPKVTSGEGETLIEGSRFHLRVHAGDPDDEDAWKHAISTCTALVMQVRFMDALSMERLKAYSRALPTNPPIPMAVFMFREEGEVDFKMSCPVCGQKLWVRDTDENKRGRCPNCKRAFRLPSQAQHVKGELGLPDGVPLNRVIRGNATSCRNALANFKGHLVGGLVASEKSIDPTILLKATARIEVTNSNADTQLTPPPDDPPADGA